MYVTHLIDSCSVFAFSCTSVNSSDLRKWIRNFKFTCYVCLISYTLSIIQILDYKAHLNNYQSNLVIVIFKIEACSTNIGNERDHLSVIIWAQKSGF